MIFQLDEAELKVFREWDKPHMERCPLFVAAREGFTFFPGGAIGGTHTYSFTPTTIGVVVKVACSCGESVDLTDYDSW